MRSTLFKTIAMVARLSVLAVALCAPAEALEQRTVSFSVNAQPLASALAEFSRQADMTVTAPGRLTQGKQSPGFKGVATPIEAIAAILKGTGLQAREQGGALVIDQAQDAALLGTVQGQVLRADNKVPLRSVRVSIPGTEFSTSTDRFGRFELNVPAGEYQLRLEHPGYGDQTVPNAKVVADLALELELMLQPAAAALPEGVLEDVLEEVLVTGERYTERPIDTERTAVGIVDAIDFAQIARFDDSTVSSALSRIVGVSLEDGRYAIVRGMKSRYQSVYLNDAVLPNTDPGRRDLAMDIFPASIMQGLSLQKTASPDVPANSTAGHIDMRTKAVPDEPFLKISASVDFWDNVDDTVLRHQGGNQDWLGIDDGSRDLPAELAAIKGIVYGYYQEHPNSGSGDGAAALSDDQKEAAGESITYRDITTGKSNPNMSLDLSGGYRWHFGEQSAGVIGALRYSNKWTNRDLTHSRFSGVYAENEAGVQELIDVRLDEYYSTWDSNNLVDVSAMLNFAWQPGEGHEFGLNNILLRHTTSSTEQEYWCESCFNQDYSYRYLAGSDYHYQYTLDWIEEQLWGSQLWGRHRFDDLGGLTVDWLWLEAASQFDRPDSQTYTWSGTSLNQTPELTGGEGNTQFEWERMEEDARSYKLDLALPVFQTAPVSALLKAGLYVQKRERDGYEYEYYYNEFHRYGLQGSVTQEEMESAQPDGLFNDENIGDGLYPSIWVTNPSADTGWVGDQYIVEQNTDAYYLMADVDFWEKVQVSLGVRHEAFSIAAEMYEYTPEPLTSLLDEEYALVSTVLTYHFDDRWQLRLGYSDTVSWPEVFEMMPRTFVDYETLEQYTGNPDLKPAEIKNYDIRLEWYPAEDESVTLAWYSKDLTNAIENTFLGEGEDYSYFSFDNVPSASVDGWELDLRKLYSLGASHEFFVQFSYTDINSEVSLPADTQEWDPNRPLQGQPDYMVNLQLGYDHVPTDQQFTVVYSRHGKELAIINATDYAQALKNNIYEQPYDDLKLIYQKGFSSGLTVVVSVDNVLDSERNLEYEGYGVPYLKYKRGRQAKLKLSYTF